MNYKSELLSEIINQIRLESGEDLPFEDRQYSYGVNSERFKIRNDEESMRYDKPKGTYDIFSVPEVMQLSSKQKKYISDIISNSVSELLGKVTKSSRVLIVGLGNRHISSDSLGTKVCQGINITLGLNNYPNVMAMCPSVLGLTGIESFDIIKGVVDRVNPTHLILIDSLCASSASRLASSIQLSNTGLCPGSGVGNNRKCLDKSLCKNILSIGVPLLIYVSTFISDIFDKNNIDFTKIRNIMQSSENLSNNEEILNFIQNIENIYNDEINDIVVSHKDIEQMVAIIARIISDAINKSLGIFELNE